MENIKKQKSSANIKAVLFMISSSFFYATMNLLSKISKIMLYQKAFISNFIALFIIAVIIKKKNISFIGHKGSRKYLIIRGLSGSFSLALLYYTLDNMKLCDATMLSKLSPLFATLLGFIILKNELNFKQIFFLILTFIGALFIIKPSFSLSIIPSITGTLSALLSGLAFTMIRKIGKSENPFTIIFYNIFSASIISLPFMFFNTEKLQLKSHVVYMILAGLCIVFGQIFLTLAYRISPASKIAMYDYTGILVSAVYGIIIFHEYPDTYSLIGYSLILASSSLDFISKLKHDPEK